MFTYHVYSYDNGFDVELTDYPNKTTHCCHVSFSVYTSELNDVVDTVYETDTFVSPHDVIVSDGVINIQGVSLYNS